LPYLGKVFLAVLLPTESENVGFPGRQQSMVNASNRVSEVRMRIAIACEYPGNDKKSNDERKAPTAAGV